MVNLHQIYVFGERLAIPSLRFLDRAGSRQIPVVVALYRWITVGGPPVGNGIQPDMDVAWEEPVTPEKSRDGKWVGGEIVDAIDR